MLEERVYSMRVSIVDEYDMLETLFELKTSHLTAATFWPSVRAYLKNKHGMQLTLYCTPIESIHVMMLCKRDDVDENTMAVPETQKDASRVMCVWRKADTYLFWKEITMDDF